MRSEVMQPDHAKLALSVITLAILRINEIRHGQGGSKTTTEQGRPLEHPFLVGEAILAVQESGHGIDPEAVLIEKHHAHASLGPQANLAGLGCRAEADRETQARDNPGFGGRTGDGIFRRPVIARPSGTNRRGRGVHFGVECAR
jgi:hypothetical protein